MSKAIQQHKFQKYLVRSMALTAALSVTLILASCNKSVLYEDVQHINNASWKATDTLFYRFTVADSLQACDFSFLVRNTTSYGYQNLYLFLTAWYPDGTWSRDTAECILAAPDGRWYGKGMGKIKESKFMFRKAVHFRRSGSFTIAVNQAMRTEELVGISDIGIQIVKSEK